MDGRVEVELVVHVPLRVEDAVAVARLQFGGDGAVAAMDLDMVAVVDEAQRVVARYAMAAGGEDVAVDGLLADEDRLLAVEFLIDGDESLRRGHQVLCVPFLARSRVFLLQEGHVFRKPRRRAPVLVLLARERVHVVVAQLDGV